MSRILLALACTAAFLGAQSPEAVKAVDALNKLCEKGVSNKPVLSLAADGTITRRDNTGNVFIFNAKLIGTISFDDQGECNVLVRCKNGGGCITANLADGRRGPSDLLVFSARSRAKGEEIAGQLEALKRACGAGK